MSRYKVTAKTVQKVIKKIRENFFWSNQIVERIIFVLFVLLQSAYPVVAQTERKTGIGIGVNLGLTKESNLKMYPKMCPKCAQNIPHK
jgi:hypothetical protein